MRKKLKIGVVFGGPSSEHDISINSGRNVLQHLDTTEYTIQSIKIPRKGNWLIPFINRIKKIDVAFLALHGHFGEDGKIQALLDSLHIPYTGSGMLASAIAMDKSKTYHLLELTKITLPKYQLLESKKEKITIPLPFVVKPNASGSSVGISIVKNSKELSKALTVAFTEDKEVLIEEYIRGREFTCGILGNNKKNISLLPVAEIQTATTFFDYHAKYHDQRTQEICPAQISKKLEKKIKQQALFVHTALGCHGLTRSDFIEKKGKLYFLEINTIPGLTRESLAPKMARASGWDLSTFFKKQIRLAL